MKNVENGIATVSEMRAEAESRLAKLVKKGLHGNVAQDFKDAKLNYSLRCPLGGILYWADNENPEAQMVRDAIADLAAHTDGVPYHATVEHTEFGRLVDVLFVSDHREEWPMDAADLDEGYTFAYVYNADDPLMSEFGTIGIRTCGGGLIRTA